MSTFSTNLTSDSHSEIFNNTLFHYMNRNGTVSGTTNSPWISFIQISFALLLRAGYILIQLGTIPTENVFTILVPNILDICVCTSCFATIGNALAFGAKSWYGLISYGSWIWSADESDPPLDKTLQGIAVVSLAGSAVSTSMLAGRIHNVGHIFLSVTLSAFLQPIFMHWIWHHDGILNRRIFLRYKVGIKDHGGGMVMHLVPGMVGLMGSAFLGRRLVRLEEIAESSIGAASPGFTSIGYLFVIIGLIGLIPQNSLVTTLNSILAVSAGILVTLLLESIFRKLPSSYWEMVRCLQGGVAGLVIVCSGADVYIPSLAFVLSAIGILLFYATSMITNHSSLEDNCNIFATHLVSSIFGSLAPTLLGNSDNLGLSVSRGSRFAHFLWQIISVTDIITTSAIFTMLVFALLKRCGILGNEYEHASHERAVMAAANSEEGTSSSAGRLFSEKYTGAHRYIQPGSVKITAQNA